MFVLWKYKRQQMALSELLPVGIGVLNLEHSELKLNLSKAGIGIVLSSAELMGRNGSQQDLISTLVFA